MPKAATAIDHEARGERLREYLEDCRKWRYDSLEDAGVCADEGTAKVPFRYALQTFDGDESWIEFHDTIADARQGGGFNDEAPAMPGTLVDLDTGWTWEPEVTLDFRPMRWALRVRFGAVHKHEGLMRFATEDGAQRTKDQYAQEADPFYEVLAGPLELFTKEQAEGANPPTYPLDPLTVEAVRTALGGESNDAEHVALAAVADELGIDWTPHDDFEEAT